MPPRSSPSRPPIPAPIFRSDPPEEGGGLDEVVVWQGHGASVHLEFMSERSLWIGITRADGKVVHLNVGTSVQNEGAPRKRDVRVVVTVQEDETGTWVEEVGRAPEQ
jgi:hypothetical protein